MERFFIYLAENIQQRGELYGENSCVCMLYRKK